MKNFDTDIRMENERIGKKGMMMSWSEDQTKGKKRDVINIIFRMVINTGPRKRELEKRYTSPSLHYPFSYSLHLLRNSKNFMKRYERERETTSLETNVAVL